jgi:hypothetical protein
MSGAANERIDERLAVVEPRLRGIRAAVDAAALLQEHAGRPRRKLAPHADEILPAIRQIAVEDEAPAHHVVGGLVALEP